MSRKHIVCRNMWYLRRHRELMSHKLSPWYRAYHHRPVQWCSCLEGTMAIRCVQDLVQCTRSRCYTVNIVYMLRQKKKNSKEQSKQERQSYRIRSCHIWHEILWPPWSWLESILSGGPWAGQPRQSVGKYGIRSIKYKFSGRWITLRDCNV